MKIITLILQVLTLFMLFFGTLIALIYAVISVKSHHAEWMMLGVGLGLVALGALIIALLRKREHIPWPDVIGTIFIWP